MYDTVAKEYSETFSGEHQKKPKAQEILRRFSIEIGDKKRVWDFGCGPGQTTKYLKDLGIEIAGLDLSEKILEQARTHRIRMQKVIDRILDSPPTYCRHVLAKNSVN